MSVVTIPNLEIIQAGVEYQVSTGTVSFTMEDLADAVRAANEDPAIKAPRLKLGHTDPLNATLAEEDGQPALGTVQNMRLNDKGNVVIGDYVGVPEWLAEIMPSAYPSRSFEGDYNYKSNGTDRRYRMVVKAVALLGVRWPGCATIDDIQTLYGSSRPDGVEIAASEGGVRVSFSIAASVNVDDVRRQFYDGPGDTNAFMWVQAVYVDPYEVIVMNEDDDQLERYSYECSPEGEVTFGEPEPVIVQYVPDPLAAGGRVGMIAASGKPVAIYASRSESRPYQQQDDPKGGQEMTPEELRQSIGLPAEATDEEVRAKLAELQGDKTGATDSGQQQTQPQPTAGPTDEPSQQNVEDAARRAAAEAEARQGDSGASSGSESGSEGEGTAASGMVSVPADVWAQVQAGAMAGSRLAAESETTRRNETIAKALEKGKIAASQRDSMVNLHKVNPTSFYTLLTSSVEEGGLADNLVPVNLKGNNPGGDELAASELDYPSEWLAPNERARIAAAAAGAVPGSTTTAGKD